MYTSQRALLVSADLHRYPMIDDRAACARTYILTSASSSGRKRTTISAGVSLYATAARAADVSGLPPTFISVGGLDLFLEENMTYADRLSRAGVPVELHLYPRAYHGFYRATNARVTKQAEHDNREALRRFLHGWTLHRFCQLSPLEPETA